MNHPDLRPIVDDPNPRIVSLHRGYLRPIDLKRTARSLNDDAMLRAIEARLRGEPHNITVGPRVRDGGLRSPARRPVQPQFREAWFLLAGAVSALLWIGAFFLIGWWMQ